MDNDDQKGYKWETAYTEGLNIRNVLQESDTGSIEESVRKIVLEAKRQRRLVERPSHIKLGIMRYVYVILDCSNSMLSQALYPTRIQVAIIKLNAFLDKFFEQNPLSQMGIIICRDKCAERLVGFNSSPQMIRESLANVGASYCNGEFSLESCLLLASQSFQGLPGHSSKEIIAIVSSLVTVDASNIFTTFEMLKTRAIRCSLIGLGAEVFVFKKMCTITSGKYGIVLDESHFELLISDHIHPPAASREQEASIVKMGFPRRSQVSMSSFCMCHQLAGSSDDFLQKLTGGTASNEMRAFHCPQCSSRYCQTPVECRVCGLLLLTAPQLARAHQHLQPLPAFVERANDASTSLSFENEKLTCFCCDESLPSGQKFYACRNCAEIFCIDCDLSLHESLHICPSCG